MLDALPSPCHRVRVHSCPLILAVRSPLSLVGDERGSTAMTVRRRQGARVAVGYGAPGSEAPRDSETYHTCGIGYRCADWPEDLIQPRGVPTTLRGGTWCIGVPRGAPCDDWLLGSVTGHLLDKALEELSPSCLLLLVQASCRVGGDHVHVSEKWFTSEGQHPLVQRTNVCTNIRV